MEREKAIICDLDGTLADIEHRVHFVQSDKKDWKSFSIAQDNDKMHFWCKEVIDAMRDRGYKVILLSGRGEKYRHLTEEWLKNYDIHYDLLLLRKRKDYRDDPMVKREIYDSEVKEGYDTLFVLDDRASVVKMWREIGLVCLQCDWGNF